jgi:transcriptional regulator with XRE-family HTH domain
LSDQTGPTELGRRIRHLRNRRSWSQEELARRSQLGLMAISRIENGGVREPKRDSLRRIAAALEVPFADLDALLTAQEPAANGVT